MSETRHIKGFLTAVAFVGYHIRTHAIIPSVPRKTLPVLEVTEKGNTTVFTCHNARDQGIRTIKIGNVEENENNLITCSNTLIQKPRGTFVDAEFSTCTQSSMQGISTHTVIVQNLFQKPAIYMCEICYIVQMFSASNYCYRSNDYRFLRQNERTTERVGSDLENPDINLNSGNQMSTTATLSDALENDTSTIANFESVSENDTSTIANLESVSENDTSTIANFESVSGNSTMSANPIWNNEFWQETTLAFKSIAVSLPFITAIIIAVNMAVFMLIRKGSRRTTTEKQVQRNDITLVPISDNSDSKSEDSWNYDIPQEMTDEKEVPTAISISVFQHTKDTIHSLQHHAAKMPNTINDNTLKWQSAPSDYSEINEYTALNIKERTDGFADSDYQMPLNYC